MGHTVLDNLAWYWMGWDTLDEIERMDGRIPRVYLELVVGLDLVSLLEFLSLGGLLWPAMLFLLFYQL